MLHRQQQRQTGHKTNTKAEKNIQRQTSGVKQVHASQPTQKRGPQGHPPPPTNDRCYSVAVKNKIDGKQEDGLIRRPYCPLGGRGDREARKRVTLSVAVSTNMHVIK